MKFINTNLRGVGQIMLQNDPTTGFLFLLGIFYNSWVMGAGAIVGVLSGTLTAIFAKFKKEDIGEGLYGFNGTLVGLALTFFYEFNLTTAILIVIFSVISSFVMHFMHTRKWNPFTFPFVLSAWIAIWIINYYGIIEKSISWMPPVLELDILNAVNMGFGQVMFQGNSFTGIVFLLAVLVSSWKSAWFGMIGSFVGLLVGVVLSMPIDLLTVGIFGYNAVLCGIAFSHDKKFSYLSAILAMVISVLILDGFMSLNIIALTAPFVFATWITMFLMNKIVKS